MVVVQPLDVLAPPSRDSRRAGTWCASADDGAA